MQAEASTVLLFVILGMAGVSCIHLGSHLETKSDHEVRRFPMPKCPSGYFHIYRVSPIQYPYLVGPVPPTLAPDFRYTLQGITQNKNRSVLKFSINDRDIVTGYEGCFSLSDSKLQIYPQLIAHPSFQEVDYNQQNAAIDRVKIGQTSFINDGCSIAGRYKIGYDMPSMLSFILPNTRYLVMTNILVDSQFYQARYVKKSDLSKYKEDDYCFATDR